MIIIAFAAAAMLLPPQDTLPIFDSAATEALVRRAITASRDVPADLRDYEARVQSSLSMTVATDSLAGSDFPASVDEVVSIVRWNRSEAVHQEVQGHRTRLVIPMPYTLATILERPWVIPHLYGSSLFTPFAGPRAISPFGARGPEFYRYQADAPVRITVQGETINLLPISVRPRVATSGDTPLLVLGTFFLDADRAAVARARFGFIGDEGALPASVGRLETFLELDNALWQGRYWLPFQQRRDILFHSRVLGGAVAARVINRFTEIEFNTGWTPTGERISLTWSEVDDAFADWRAAVGEDAGRFSTEDFADLRIATETASPGGGGARFQIHFARANHLVRYNRVEGPYLGLGARVTAADPRRNRWQLYGTAGWAFAEKTARGELAFGWGSVVAPSERAGRDWGVQVAGYRRLMDIQAFRPTHSSDWIHTLPAALWGSDIRDYYDATGVEAALRVAHGRLSGRVGGRYEEHDSVSVNTTRFLFGEATDFGPLAGVDPGKHAAIEAGGGYALGPGAFGIGNSAVATLETEVGVGDFSFTRLTGLMSMRFNLGPFTLASRVDGGHLQGDGPPQKLFRFGSVEGLRGYEPNEFGGSTALLARGRFLIGLPPRSSRPLARISWLLIPPLRPSLVLIGESGYTSVDADLADELGRLRARTTDGARTAIGAGISLLDDALTIEYLKPVGSGSEDRKGRWYFGMTSWY